MNDRDLRGLRAVEHATVLKAGRPVATLARGAGRVRFAYHPGMASAGGPAVATTLPVTTEPIETTSGAIPPFFAGLLPEGRRLTSLRQAIKTSADDELSLLLAVGADTIGDVQVLPDGVEPGSVPPLVEIEQEVSSLRFRDLLATASVLDPVGLPGIQEKASARMISVPVSRSGARYLLKVEPPEFPHVISNEALFLALARHAGLPAARGQVVRDVEGRHGLLIERFDRTPLPDGGTEMRACEDACQVLGRWPADKYRVAAEDVVASLSDHCAARVVAVRDLFRQLLFAYLTGNGDLHAKNLSILQDADGEWRVAPAYDLPATVPYGDTTMALPIQARQDGISRRHWLAFANSVGLPAPAAERVIESLLRALADLGPRLRDGLSPFAQKPTADWVAELRHRHELVRRAR